MLAVRFLRQIRVPVAAAVPSAPARTPRFRKFDAFHTWMQLKGLKSQVLYTAPNLCRDMFVIRVFCQYARILRKSGLKLPIGSMIVGAALGSTSLWPRTAYCEDGSNNLSDHSQKNSSGAPCSKETLSRIILLIRKLIVPLFLFLTVWQKWGQSHPVFLAARVMLIFFCTKPIPSSVYIFVDQLRIRIMNQQPLLYRFKPLHANKVDVEDYTLVCVARVHIKDEKLMLIGILGSWWILPFSSLEEVYLFDKLSWKEAVSLIKSRFRLAADMTWY